MTGVLVALFVLLAVVGSLVRYALVRSEHADRERMDREHAERAARRAVDAEADASGREPDTRRRST